MHAANPTHQCSRLYAQCTLVFASFISKSSILEKYQREIFGMKNSFGKFLLWSEGFEDNTLDMVMSQSPMLKDTALQFLLKVGTALLDGKISH
jgi:hypothetical protein